MKARLLTLLIVLVATTTGAWAVKDKTVEIGIEQGGTQVTTVFPFYTYRTYHMSQQIYTSEEIGIPQGGLLKSISLYYDHSNMSYALERSTNLTIKLANTEVESLQGDYPKTTQSKKWVAGGTTYTFSNFTLPATSGWITITFNSPFAYNGKNLAILVYSEMIKDYQYGRFRSYNCGKYQSLYVNYDIEWADNNYSATSHTFNPNTPGKYTGRPGTTKNQIKMLITPNPGLSFSDVVAPEQVKAGQSFTMSANVTNIDEEDASPETTVYVEASADGSTWQTVGQQSLSALDGGATTQVSIENIKAALAEPAPENILLRLRADAFNKSFYSSVKSVPYIGCTHVAGDPVQENVTEPTCEGGGSYEKVTYCTLCGIELSREATNTDPLGHNWGEPTYIWNEDNSQVTASRTCKRDESHVDSETVQTNSEVTKEPTATEPAEITYTATFTNSAFTTQTKVVTVHTEEAEVCDYYHWDRDENTYTTSGEYTYYTDTDVYTLNLTIHNSTSEILEREVYIGQHFNEYPFEFDVTADTPLTWEETITNVAGCDSVITLNLTIVSLDDYYYDDKLGHEYSPELTTFKLWDPTAKSVKLNRYATGTDGEAEAQDYGSTEMNKLMEGDNWTGVWTCTIAGDLKGTYYTYSVNGTEIADPWSQAVGFDGERSMVFDAWDVAPYGWDSDLRVFYESGNKIESIDVATFSADPMCGVSEGHRGKYLALTEDNTTYENAGELPTCMNKLKADGCKAVIVTMADPQMVPDQYSTNPYDGTTVINEVQQAIMAIHKTFGMSFFVRFDFSTIPVNETLRQKYITETITYWVDMFHVDGIVLATDIDAKTKALIRDLLDAYDERIVLATDDEATGIRDAIVEKSSDTDNWFTIDGRKVTQPAKKGLYIKNNKKVMIK